MHHPYDVKVKESSSSPLMERLMSDVGTISFCDKRATNVRDPAFKDAILQYLDRGYGIRVIRKHHDTVDVEGFTRALNARRERCLVCLRSRGNPYFFFLTRLDGQHPVCIFIDKKIRPGHSHPRMVMCPMHFEPSLFEDTVLEGEMVRPVSKESEDGTEQRWTFLIHDVPVYRGWRAVACGDLHHRLHLAMRIVHMDHRADARTDPCQFVPKRYFRHDQLEHVMRSADGCRGVFVRDVRANGTRDLLLRFDHAFGNDDGPRLTQTFTVFKSDKPDVYGMLGPSAGLLSTRGADGETVYAENACVPCLQVSSYLRKLFEDKRPHVDGVCIRCEFRPCFEKWVPTFAVTDEPPAKSSSPPPSTTLDKPHGPILRGSSVPNLGKRVGAGVHGGSGPVAAPRSTCRRSFEACLAGGRDDHCRRPLSDGACAFRSLSGIFDACVRA